MAWLSHSCLSSHQLIGGLGVFIFYMLRITLLQTSLYTFSFEHLFSILVDVYIGAELHDRLVNLCLTLSRLASKASEGESPDHSGPIMNGKCLPPSSSTPPPKSRWLSTEIRCNCLLET